MHLSSPARAACSRAQERLTAWPTSTLALALAQVTSDALVLDEVLAALDARGIPDVEMGADAVEALGRLLDPDGVTIPAPPPTIEAPPTGPDLIRAAQLLALAQDQIQEAAALLDPRWEVDLATLRSTLGAMAGELADELEDGVREAAG
jgi:hypothetical protein